MESSAVEGNDASKDEQDTDDTFKKPAVFSARGPVQKRNVTAAFKEKTETESDGCPNGTKLPQKEEAEEEEGDKEKDAAAAKLKSGGRTRVLPAKGPPAGSFPPLPYTEPPWGRTAPHAPYSLEVLKNGTIVDTVPFSPKSYLVVGRLPVCDVTLDHPSVSRYHAVLQYRGQAGQGEDRGVYVHDLGSTHGTVVNKNRIPPKTYIRLHVGHVLKFGGSTRLFILQGPEFDEEEESELTVTELRERARKQKAELEKRMMGENSDDEEEGEMENAEGKSEESHGKASSDDSGCSWGMAEEVVPEEDANEENPFSTEFIEDQEAAYLKDPKKALQGFYDREGEELEFEYEDKNHGAWLCRIKLPVDDAMGRQLVAEVTHTGKKKEAAVHCCLEACRMLEARGLLRQEAVSRKRKKKNWEDEDYYDSDDDTFLDRTGTVERKRQERMKKAGKIEECPETYESLVAKLSEVKKELEETQKKLSAGKKDSSSSSTEDPLDAFMNAVRSEATMDTVERRKLHVHLADLRKDAQRLCKLVELARPAQMPSLLPSSEPQKKTVLPLFGAMKGGSKFKLKTGTIGKLPPKRPNLPTVLFNMKELPPGGEEEEDEDETEDQHHEECPAGTESNLDSLESKAPDDLSGRRKPATEQSHKQRRADENVDAVKQVSQHNTGTAPAPSSSGSKTEGVEEPHAEPSPQRTRKKVIGPSRSPAQLSAQYPEDDPDYCVWVPPAGQTGDGRTHLNDKYGY
ncbi:kanadaptin [Thalassophryne amazonica]|uniref:kanadaptin n=1 Tax=Thalassophryne amazonica TaxID=390379 RepID=UPI001471117A|nr:kanadaptin [Thalassophryne amazonica]